MEKEKFYEENRTSDIVADEGLMSKFIRNGLIFAGVSALAAKSRGTNKAKIFDNEVFKLGTLAVGAYAFSRDDDRGGDLLTASSFLFASAGLKHAREVITNDVDAYKKAYTLLTKADNIKKHIYLGSMNLSEKITDTFKYEYAKALPSTGTKGASIPSVIYNQALKPFAAAAFNTAITPFDAIRKKGLVEGLRHNFEMSGVSSSYIKAQSQLYDTFDTEVYNASMGLYKPSAISAGNAATDILTKVSNKAAGFVTGGAFGNEAFANIDFSVEEAEFLKKASKYKEIQRSSGFVDILGRFTKYNETTGKIDARYDRVMEEGANFFAPLNDLAGKFRREARGAYKTFDDFNPRTKEAMFLEFLQKNGMQDVIDKTYNVPNLVSMGEINEKIAGKHISEVFKEDSGLASMFVRSKGKAFLDITEESRNENAIIGIKNIDILKNFAVTNVISKSANGFEDSTTMNGTIMSLQALGTVEKTFVGMYKNPLARRLNTWNPFKLIDADNRIKSYIANDTLGFGKAENGLIINGRFIESAMEEVSTNPDGTLIKGDRTRLVNAFFSDDSKAYKQTFSKNTRDVIDQHMMVHNSNIKSNTTYKELYNTFKSKGFKPMLQQLSDSNTNFTGFRYSMENGFRKVKEEDSYYLEGSLIGSMLDKKDIDYRVLGIDNRNMEKKAGAAMDQFVGNMIMFLNDEKKNGNINNYTEEIVKIRSHINRGFKIEAENLTEELIRFADSTGDSAFKNAAATIYGIDPDVFQQKGFKANKLNSFIQAMEQQVNAGFSKGVYNDENKEYINKMLEFKKAQMTAKFTDLYANDFNIDTLNVRMLKKGLADLDPEEVEKTMMSYIRNGLNYDDFNFIRDMDKNEYVKYASYNMDDMAQIKGLSKKRYEDILAKGSFKAKSGSLLDEKRIEEYRLASEDLVGKYKSITREQIDKFNDIPLEEYDDLFKDAAFHSNVKAARIKATKATVREINKNAVIDSNTYNMYLENNSLEDSKNLFNKSYEAALGFEYSKLEGDADAFLKRRDDLTDYFRTDLGDNEFLKLNSAFYNDQFTDDLSRNYANGNLRKFGAALFNTKNIEENGPHRSYKYFKDMRNKDKILTVNNPDIYSFMEDYEESNYKIRGQQLTNSSYILEDTMKKHLEAKNILENVELTIRGFQSKLKPWTGGEFKNKSKFFGQRETTFGVGMKTVFSNLQNALETLGIERISSDDLGVNWTDHVSNFFKYRYLPIAGVVAGAIAADSAFDALIPDETPIIGNGLTGIATRGYATARVGLQYGLKYTGALSAMRAINDSLPIFDNGLTSWFDPLMDPSEMIDVYFKGKAVRVNKNRNWFTAGRQSGEGEEFGQYRPHMLYTLGSPTAGIYDNKFEKFFRQDFLLTKYPWYMIDPYKEERDAYEKFGAKYPITEQLFKDVPVFGHLLSATIGEAIKPTQYAWENEWRVGENVMRNPNYDPRNPSSPEFMEFKTPNRFAQAFFEGVEDLQTFSGLPGYAMKTVTNMMFGASNPYEDEVVLNGIDLDTNLYAAYDKLQLGGLMGMTEPIRRLLDSNSALGTIAINPIEQELPEYMPAYFRNGNNPFMRVAGAEHFLGGEATEKTVNYVKGNEELNMLKTLSMIAPGSGAFRAISAKMQQNLGDMTDEEKRSYYESLSYAANYGTREYTDNSEAATDLKKINVTIDRMLSPYEFLGKDKKRYKIDSVQMDYNKLSEEVGTKKAEKLMNALSETFKAGETYSFNISQNSAYSVGIDRDGDYLKVDSGLIDSDLRDKESVYNRRNSIGKALLFPLTRPYRFAMNSPMPTSIEKIIGKKSVLQEWSAETVQSPYFRDWDLPMSSFVEPVYNFSANSLVSGMAFNTMLGESFNNSNALFNPLGLLNMAGMLKRPLNMLTGNVNVSSEYEQDTIVGDELEKIKMLAGDKSYYTMRGNESLKQFEAMVNEQDSRFLKDLANVANTRDREQILATGNERLGNVLKTIWNRHQNLLSPGNNGNMYDVERSTFDSAVDIGLYDGNVDRARILLKKNFGFGISKLDAKRQGIISSHRGGISKREADYISDRMYRHYNSRPRTIATIYPKGNIDIVKTED